jgi:hypothetical protein
MRLAYRLLVLSTTLLPGAIPALAIAHTVAAAEAEGRQFDRPEARNEQTSLLVTPSSGTNERRCVAPPPTDDSLVNGALRSGDLLARARFAGPQGFRAGKEQKVLWLPLHAVRGTHVTLLLRAARVGQPLDTLRQMIPGSVYSHGATGYPSALGLRTAGDWLVVATAERDWGCFLLHVDR